MICAKYTDSFFSQLGFLCWDCKKEWLKKYDIQAKSSSLLDIETEVEWIRKVDKGNKVAPIPPTS
jgi:hypothetical protein